MPEKDGVRTGTRFSYPPEQDRLGWGTRQEGKMIREFLYARYTDSLDSLHGGL